MNDDCWEILGIPPTDDKVKIKKAFAAQLKLNPPDKDAGMYQKIRQAYTDAVNSSASQKLPEEFFQEESHPAVHAAAQVPPEPEKNGAEEILDSNPLSVAAGMEGIEEIQNIRSTLFDNQALYKSLCDQMRGVRYFHILCCVIFIPVSILIMIRGAGKYGGNISIVFNLLAGFLIIRYTFRMCFRLQKDALNEATHNAGTVNKYNLSSDLHTLQFLHFIVSVICMFLLKIIFRLTGFPEYMRHFFGGVFFFYCIENYLFLRKTELKIKKGDITF